ncbi:DUF3617 family protein [Porphyrobacter sp. ULC335]|uniref:DUF3617 family protein n=1 Tax=Porphyrobacter sp. ULC335 TaxID=2854260 RepID=UPI002220DE57|nr:DUF3617 family protein [Porphyrobacter sp. ULC335]UYV16103.1 DUF3617 family protein [Porphyrobacter sp. ULC335]
MHRGFVCLALIAGVAAPALAEGYDKLDLFRAIGLAEGEWATVLTVENMVVTPTPDMADDADMAEAIAGAKAVQGSVFNTTDCLGNGLSANGDLVLPGVSIAAECTITERTVSGDNFAITAKCGKASDFTVTFKGSKTGTGIDGTADMHMASARMTTAITTRIKSTWVKACTVR